MEISMFGFGFQDSKANFYYCSNRYFSKDKPLMGIKIYRKIKAG
jgi:hypothetical protein